MDQKWKILYFKTAHGANPVFEFINGLDAKVKSKVINIIDLLQEFGIKLGLPHAKRLVGSPLWELRVLGSDNIRIFYIAIVNKTFLLLHGFHKKKQKTDRREIKVAMGRLREHISRPK